MTVETKGGVLVSTEGSVAQPRVVEGAPDALRNCGGIALSLWLSGANETDCLTVARLDAERQMLADELRDLRSVNPDLARLVAVEAAAREIVESFTDADGSFTPDDLTEREWRALGDSLLKGDGDE